MSNNNPLPPADHSTDPVVMRLRFALYRYGGHVSPCPGRPCECGFKAEWDFAGLPATVGDAIDLLRLKELNGLSAPAAAPSSSREDCKS